MLRTLLGRAAGIAPVELAFRREPGLKPVMEARLSRPLHFSLSRSEELALIGLASRPIGVDIEWLGKTVDTEVMSDFVFSDRERAAFRRLDPSDRQKAFLQCWTQKEAYLKAVGLGLYISPATVEVGFGSEEAAGLKTIAGDSRAAACWHIDLVVPREGYIGAVASQGSLWRTRVRAFDTSSLIFGSG